MSAVPLVPFTGRVGAQLLKLGGVHPRHLGQAAGGVGEPGEDLIPFPLVVGAYLVEFPCGVFTCPRGLGAGVLGPGLGRRSALVRRLSGLPELLGLLARLVPGITGGTHEGRGLGPGLLDRFLPLRLGAARTLLGRGDALGLVCLGPRDRGVPLFLGDGDARLGLLAEPLHLGGPRAKLRYMRAVEACPGARDRASALLPLYAGTRIAEIRALDVADVRLSARKGEVHLVGKGEKSRTVPVHPKLREALAAWRARRVQDLTTAAVLPDPRAERRRRLAEPDLECSCSDGA